MTGKILIVDDVATNRIVLKVKLERACYETLLATNGAEALRQAREARPDLILLDVQLPDIDGVAVCEALRADPATRTIPIVMISAHADPAVKLRALRAGADEFLLKPLNEAILLARLRSLMRMRAAVEELRLRDATCHELGFAEAAESFAHTPRVVLVGGRGGEAVLWKSALAPHLRDGISVADRDTVLADAAADLSPELFVIAADIERAGDGLRLMSELRSRPATRHAAICIVAAPGARDTAAMALDLGANDLVFGDFLGEELALRIGAQIAHKRLSDRLRATVADGLRLAVIDPLTGLYNRRYALPHIERIAERAAQSGRSFAVMVLDIDRFKAVNDTYGHAAGDAVLVEIAARMRASLRDVDMLARIGGEEFLVALPEAGLEAAQIAAERLRRVIAERPVRLAGNGGEIAMTLSVGMAMGGGAGSGTTADAIIKAADLALLHSKTDGRNLVTVSRSAA